MAFTFRPKSQIDHEQHLEELKTEEQELLSYLSSTDWYVARWGETQKPIPEDITLKRQNSRDRITVIREELNNGIS